MGARKPCLGYPSRTAAVHGLRAQHMTTREIAIAIGIPEKTVVALEIGSSRPRRAPSPQERTGRTITVPIDVLDALGPHAAERGCSSSHLARVILTTVLDEDMVDAVLDDAADRESWLQ